MSKKQFKRDMEGKNESARLQVYLTRAKEEDKAMAVHACKGLQALGLSKEAEAASLQGEEWHHEDPCVEMLESIVEEKLHLNSNEVEAAIKRAGLPNEQQEEQLACSGRRWKIAARKESVQEVKAQEVARLIVVKEIMAKSADILRRIVDMGEMKSYEQQ